MTDLAELIEKVEKATEGSRKLDADIALIVAGWTYEKRKGDRSQYWRDPDDIHPTSTYQPRRDLPRYTDSMDAALSLVERKLPGAFWHVAKGRMTAAEPLFGAALFFGADEELGHGESFNAATSLVLALLRSLRAQN